LEPLFGTISPGALLLFLVGGLPQEACLIRVFFFKGGSRIVLSEGGKEEEEEEAIS
jgi:hypothetical protein